MKKWGLLLLLPLAASAQPPGYTCTHWNDYYLNGTPPPGAPNECEAVGSHATDDSFTYFFPVSANATPTQSVPEVDPSGAAAALTLLGLILAWRADGFRRPSARAATETSRAKAN